MNAPAALYTDAAKRCSDTIRLHIACGSAGKWAAIRMADGGSDGIAYDTRRDAIGHQLHEQYCAYIKVPPDDMPPEHAMRFLAAVRRFYDAGFRLVDPDDEREPILPYRDEDLKALLGRKLPWTRDEVTALVRQAERKLHAS